MQKTQETLVWSLGGEDPLEEEMAPHSSILAWRIPWTEEPGRLQHMGLQRVRHNWSNLARRVSKDSFRLHTSFPISTSFFHCVIQRHSLWGNKGNASGCQSEMATVNRGSYGSSPCTDLSVKKVFLTHGRFASPALSWSLLVFLSCLHSILFCQEPGCGF